MLHIHYINIIRGCTTICNPLILCMYLTIVCCKHWKLFCNPQLFNQDEKLLSFSWKVSIWNFQLLLVVRVTADLYDTCLKPFAGNKISHNLTQNASFSPGHDLRPALLSLMSTVHLDQMDWGRNRFLF